jgi:hypothetical protein
MEQNFTIIAVFTIMCVILFIGYYSGYRQGYQQSSEDDMNRRIDEDDLADLDRRIEEAIKQTRNHGTN